MISRHYVFVLNGFLKISFDFLSFQLNILNIFLNIKMLWFFERSKTMFSECSCGTFKRNERTFRRNIQRTFLKPSIGKLRELL